MKSAQKNVRMGKSIGEIVDKLKHSTSRNKIVCFLLLSSFCILLNAQGNYEFGPSIIVNDDPPGTHQHFIGSAGRHGIVCHGDTVYVAWSDDRNGYNAVHFSRSTDAGQTWSQNTCITNHWSSVASLALDHHNNIYMVFCGAPVSDEDIYFTKSTDGGETFSSLVMVNDSTRELQTYPSIAVDSSGQNIYVAFVDWRNPVGTINIDVYCARSTDGGASFETEVRVDDTGSDTSWQEMPSVGCSVSGDTVYIAWMDDRNRIGFDWDVYFARSIDAGQTFESNMMVNDTTIVESDQWFPSLSVNSIGNVYIGWMDYREGVRIYCDKSTNGGVDFNQDVAVSDSGYAAAYPSLVADDSEHVYVAWSDSRTFSSTGHDIYFSFSSDSGKTFSSDVRVNDLEGIQNAWDWTPNVTANNEGKVFVAWRSERNDPSMTYFDIYSAAGTFIGINEYQKSRTKRKKPVIMIEPNPFRNVTTFRITLTIKDCNLNIYNVTGRVVKSFCLHNQNESALSVYWNGTDQANCPLSAGVYFCQLNHGEVIYSKKIIKVE